MKKRLLYLFVLGITFFQFSCVKNGCIEKQKKDCNYLMVYDPVCGCNGKTYSNSGEAACASITQYTPGICKE